MAQTGSAKFESPRINIPMMGLTINRVETGCMVAGTSTSIGLDRAQEMVLNGFLSSGNTAARLFYTSPEWGKGEEALGILKGEAEAFLVTECPAVKAAREEGEAFSRRLRESVERSLAHLGAISMLMLAGCPSEDEKGRVLEVLAPHILSRTVRNLGLSAPGRLEGSQGKRFSELLAEDTFSGLVLPYNQKVPFAGSLLIPIARRNKVAVLARSPFAGGQVFAGKQHSEWEGISDSTIRAAFDKGASSVLVSTTNQQHLAENNGWKQFTL